MDTCHYCHESINRSGGWSEIVGGNGTSRLYHTDCHRLDILEHRERGERLPEDAPGPPLTGVVWSSGYGNQEHCSWCGGTGHLFCSKWD